MYKKEIKNFPSFSFPEIERRKLTLQNKSTTFHVFKQFYMSFLLSGFSKGKAFNFWLEVFLKMLLQGD